MKLRIYFFDDMNFYHKMLHRLFENNSFIFTDSTGTVIKPELIQDEFVANAFKRSEFTNPLSPVNPEGTAPFDLILMDQQHGDSNKPSDGGKFILSVTFGTDKHPDLKSYGQLKGGYKGKTVMFSGEKAYLKHEEGIKKLRELGVYDNDLIKKGYPKDGNINPTYLRALFAAELEEYGIEVTLNSEIDSKSKNKLLTNAQSKSASKKPPKLSTQQALFKEKLRHKKFKSDNNLAQRSEEEGPFTAPAPFSPPVLSPPSALSAGLLSKSPAAIQEPFQTPATPAARYSPVSDSVPPTPPIASTPIEESISLKSPSSSTIEEFPGLDLSDRSPSSPSTASRSRFTKFAVKPAAKEGILSGPENNYKKNRKATVS